jgi:hypothetical protein
MNYKDGQYLCTEAKEEYLWKVTRELVEEVRCDASYSEPLDPEGNKVKKLLKEHFKTMTIVNEVLDKLHHEFWVCYEDK